ncbi:MAG: hypothetical protein ACKOYG_04960 [Ilumatobacteraceae bacterium]
MAAEPESSGPEPHEPRSLVEQLLDLALYAPLGAVDAVRREMPRLARRGRSQFEQQVRTARWVGEMAVRMGQSKIASEVAARRRPPERAAAPDDGADAATPVAGAGLHLVEPAVVAAEPFPGYDTLPAAELVPLLGRLSRPELEAVRGYESAMRNRRTVLARVEQLLAA